MMKFHHLMILAAGAALVTSTVPVQAATIQVTPTLAPNAYGSPSYAGWVSNSNNALHDGLSTNGAAGPTQYNADSNVTSAEAIVTGFPSWMGQADPGNVFGPGYANELGNRMLFGVKIDGDGTQFSVAGLSFSAYSTDPDNGLAFGFGDGSYGYNSDYWGVLKGSDNVLWTNDDVFITSGLNTQLVDGFIGRGSGNSFAAYCPGCTTAQQQAEINDTAAYPGEDFKFIGTYKLGNDTGTGTFNISAGAVPEPATWAMMITGFGMAGVALRRRKAILA